MLLEFKVENYKSFRDEITFSMIPAPKQKGLDYSILREKIGKNEYKGLSTSVVYGANAAGKTNIIGAIQTFKNIVLRGNIRNCENNSINPADCLLELIPNNTIEKKDVFFDITFIHSGLLIDYSLKIDLGKFLDNDHERKIKAENLNINGKDIFIRTNDNLNINKTNLKFINEYLSPDFLENLPTINKIAADSLADTELFLSNGFKTIISPRLANLIYVYFVNYLKTCYHSDFLDMIPSFEKETFENEMLNEIANNFGLNSNKLVYVKPEKSQESPILCSLFNNDKIIPAKLFESYGTIRFISIYPFLAQALKCGSTVIIDEFDSSIHPMAIMNIVNIFHNDEINKKHAQLIFNTHNPLYLNGNILRRDEIKFVERDDDTKCSKLYSLSDFGTKGTNARKGKDYMDNYFVNEYGAIRDIDFTDAFKKIVEE